MGSLRSLSSDGRSRPQWYLEMVPHLERCGFSFDIPNSEMVICSRLLVEFNCVEWSSIAPEKKEHVDRLDEGIYIERTEYPNFKEKFLMKYLVYIQSSGIVFEPDDEDNAGLNRWEDAHSTYYQNCQSMTDGLDDFIRKGRAKLNNNYYDHAISKLRYRGKLRLFLDEINKSLKKK